MSAPPFAGLLGDFLVARGTNSLCNHCLIVKLGASLRDIEVAVMALVGTAEFRTELLMCDRCLEPSHVIRHCA